jgi:hypothetical protein
MAVMKVVTVRNVLMAILASAFLLTLLTPIARAEEATESEFHDRLMIRGGWAYVWGADANVSIGGPVLGVGANIDFTNTLGGNSSTDAFRLDGLYRFNDRHAIGLSWYRVGLSGQKTLNQDILIDDQGISANATTQTSLSFNIWRLVYNYSFYHNDKVELGVSPGLYMMQTKFNFSAQGQITSPTAGTIASTVVSEQLTIPLPSIGLVANYNITPKLQFQSRYDFFYLAVGEYTGTMFEFYAGLEYRLFQHFAMGAAFDRLSAGLKASGDEGFNVNFSYNLAYVYATLYAF